jgi:hypothetical protein
MEIMRMQMQSHVENNCSYNKIIQPLDKKKWRTLLYMSGNNEGMLCQ